MHAVTRLLAAALLFLPLTVSAQDSAEAPPAEAPPPAEPTPPAEPPPGAAQAKALAELLRDDAAREALVARLLEVAEGQAAPAKKAPPPDLGLVQALANTTKAGAERLAEVVTTTTAAIGHVGELFRGDTAETMDAAIEVVKALALLVVVTVAIFLVLRFVARRLFLVLERRAEEAPWWQRLFLLILYALIEAICALGAWAAGYGFALAFGEAGAMYVAQTLFLNAFLVVELVKAALRAVLAPRGGKLRLLPISDETATYWTIWCNRVVSLVGYSMLLVVPIVNLQVSVGAGRALAVLVALTVLTIALLLVMQNRQAGRDALTRAAERADSRLEQAALALLARSWHVLAILYVLAIFVVWAASGEAGLRDMGWSTLQSLVAVAIGAVVIGFISRWISAGMHLSDDVRARLPLLEARLNAYVPAILKVVRLVVILGVVVALGQIWSVVDFLTWFEGEGGREFLLRIVSAALIAVVALVIYLAVSSWVEYRLNPDYGGVPSSRERTLLALLRNAFTIALVVITLMLVLAQLGVNIAPLLAGAGVLGLAIGFGAQKLVQDVITGAFIQLENAMNQGDVVTVGGITGTVERLTIRSVGLRDLHGVYHVIPFSSADSVSNFMKGFSYHVIQMGVAYRENVAEVKERMQEAFDRLSQTDHGANIIAPLEMHGVSELGNSAVVVRARIKCLPGTQWAMGRAYNEIAKEIFDANGIEIPFPHMTVYMGEDKDGHAPPLHIAQESTAATAPPAPTTQASPERDPGPGAGPEPDAQTA